MGEECPGVHRLGMTGQRPMRDEVTSFLTVVTSTPDGRAGTCDSRHPKMRHRTGGWVCCEGFRVTMGAVSRPVRPPQSGSEDAALVRRIRAGDRGAVDDLYERFRRPAFALARRILADDVLAEDVLQDVFLSVWRNPSAYDRARGSFASWLLALVHHKAVDSVRREESQRRRQSRAGDELVLAAPTEVQDVEAEAWS